MLYILWDDWLTFMISGFNEKLLQQLEYTLLKPDCHSWWISKMQSGRCHDNREMVKLLNSDPAVLDVLVTFYESWIYCYEPETKRQSFQWKHAGCPRLKKARQSKSIHQLLMIPFFHSTGMIYMPWVPTGQTVNKEYYVEVLREFSKRFRRKRPALPIVQTLLLVTFANSLSSRKNLEAVIMRQLRRWKRLWRRSLTRSHKRTCMVPSRSCWNGTTSALQLEEITWNGIRVSCVYYQ